MPRKQPKIIGYFYQEDSGEIGAEYWTKEISKHEPTDELPTRKVQRLINIKHYNKLLKKFEKLQQENAKLRAMLPTDDE